MTALNQEEATTQPAHDLDAYRIRPSVWKPGLA